METSPAPATIGEALRQPGIEPLEARMLLEHVLELTHAQLLARRERALQPDERERFLELVARRRAGEPVAYLIGWREFYGRRFAVDASVLIPRPETELLVDEALRTLAPERPTEVLDLGTGSGCIAITLALERPRWRLTAAERSAPALALARRNAGALGAENVAFVRGDWFAPLADARFDLIVSNPPYVADGAPHLDEGDLRFEPRTALRAGPDGLDAIRTIVAEAPRYLRPGGWLLFEHGFDQAPACRALLEQAGFEAIATAADLAELPRVTRGRTAA